MNKKKIDSRSSDKAKSSSDINFGVKNKRKRWLSLILKVGLYSIVFAVIFGFSLSYKVIFSSEGVFSRQNTSFFEQIKHLVTSGDKSIAGENTDRINIMLVGMGGPGHDGSYLSDTIIVASLKPSTKEVALLSIPRDLYVEIPEYGWRKINNANAFGYLENPDKGGEQLLSTVLEEVLDQKIHYYASIDFSGFTKIINLLGGINIEVENSFYDYQYPDSNYGYQTISFQAGQQKMDGDSALKYVRSRHGTNGEGSDFARSRRQQQILTALKKKIFSVGTLINPNKIVEISETLGSHLKTDMEVWEVLRLANLLENIDTSKIVNRVLDTSTSGLLYSETTIDGAYILKPSAGDYSEIQYLAKNIFNYTSIVKEKASIEIQNGTNINGLADSTARRLSELSYNIIKVTNAEKRNITDTVIYDLSFGQNPETIKLLQKELAAAVNQTAPLFTNSVDQTASGNDNQKIQLETSFRNLSEIPDAQEEEVDILIILGSDIVARNQSKDINLNNY